MNVALRSEPLNLISLCTGGGGLDLGVELAMPCARSVVLVEREAFCVSQLVSAISQGLMAEAAIWSDAATFDGRPWRGLVDGVIGGIPCQPHSLAGKREGSDDERDLWSDARRIIVQSGAWFVLIENVAGMLSAKPGLDPGAHRVRRDLSRLGFDIEGGLFTASEVGATHERERVFILAVANAENIGSRAFRPHRDYRSARRTGADTDSDRLADDHGGIGHKGSGSNPTRHGKPELGFADVPVELANALGERGAARLSAAAGGHGIGTESAIALNDRDAMVDASIDGRREGQSEPEFRSGRDTAAGASPAMVDAGCSEWRPQPAIAHIGDGIGRERPQVSGRPRKPGEVLADAPDRDGGLHPRQRRPGQGAPDPGRPGLFPPGPSDLQRWASVLASAPELEPAFRRVADGLASRLDIARVDRLRMLGNGVVALQAAYAFRTLCARLAARGSLGAARLVRMMEAA